MSLESIKRTSNDLPPRIVVYGGEGIGKTTFAAGAPNPVFIPTEEGFGSIETSSFPLAIRLSDVMDAISSLYSTEHTYQTVVVDSLDWLEALVWAQAAKDGGHKSIEDYGYGKGYIVAADLFRDALDGLNALRVNKKMIVILLAHSQVKRFDDPSTEPYDRYMLKLHQRTGAMVKEWCDILGFASQKVIVKKEEVGFNAKVARGISVGEHVLCLRGTPAFDAKNRYSLPDSIPLSWADLEEALVAKKGE